jgi:hypothetical protein
MVWCGAAVCLRYWQRTKKAFNDYDLQKTEIGLIAARSPLLRQPKARPSFFVHYPDPTRVMCAGSGGDGGG